MNLGAIKLLIGPRARIHMVHYPRNYTFGILLFPTLYLLPTLPFYATDSFPAGPTYSNISIDLPFIKLPIFGCE